MNWLALALALLPIDDPPAVFPAIPPAVVVDQTPQPQPIDKLAADEVLVLALSQRIALIAVPDGLVEIEETQQAPGASTVIRGHFPGGGGKVERRRYEAPFLYEVTAKSTGSVELIAVPIGLSDPTQIQRQRITLSGRVGPTPPGPSPITPPRPVGPVSTELRVLLLLDQSDSVEAQAAASAVPVLQWLDANCTQADGRAEWRRWDRSAVEASLAGAPPIFEKLYKEIRPKLPDGPQAVIARGADVSIVEISDREQLLAALKTAKGQ